MGVDEHPICITCGVQAERVTPLCRICADERQYVGRGGQAWTTLSEMHRAGYLNRIEELEPGLWGIGTEPTFAIGQRSLLVRTGAGNVLWDPIGYFDDQTVDRIRELGGVRVISASHPHFYGSIVAWSRAFDASILLPNADREWIQREASAHRFYDDLAEALPGLSLIRCGGHFDGSAVAHWPHGADGRGLLMTGDTIQVAADRQHVSFMRSYPNLIPLDGRAVTRILDAVRPFDYDRIYGGWWDRVVESGAVEAVEASARRYLRWIGG